MTPNASKRLKNMFHNNCTQKVVRLLAGHSKYANQSLLSPPSPRAVEDGKLRCSSMHTILDSIQAEHFTMLDIKGFKKQKYMSEV
jgi:hypothetical protein